VGGEQIRRRCSPSLEDLEAGFAPPVGGGDGSRTIEERRVADAVPLLERHEELDGRTGLQQAPDAISEPGFCAKRAEQQRSPGEVDRHPVDGAVQLMRKGLGRGHDEQGVEEPTLPGGPGRPP
jgi:hypothetical protein